MDVFCGAVPMFCLRPQSDCQIRLQPQLSADHMEEQQHLSSAHPSQLKKFRIYLSVARHLDYSISDEMTKVGGKDGGAIRLELSWVFSFFIERFSLLVVHSQSRRTSST